jgi:EspA-like secreted protein
MTAPMGSAPGTLSPWDNTAGPDDLEGAGIVSSYSDFGEKLGGDDGFQTAWAGASVALDTLGFVADPFQSLLSAGVGWAIEHISFLHEPLDALAGDPQQIRAAAQAWHAASSELAAIADELRGSGAPGAAATPPAGWQGAAADGYARSAADRAHRMDGLAAQGERLAVSLLKEGAAIAAVRAIVRDAIADLVAGAAEKLAGGLLLAPVTLGGAAAGAITSVVADAIALATRIGNRIAELVGRLGDAARALVDGVREAGRILGGAGSALRSSARTADDVLSGAGGDKVVEVGTQFSDTAPEDPPAPPG